MTWDHTRVEHLLAGHALGSLDPDEAALAERALLEHVPECARCRRALGEYEALAGDLALAAAPAAPPDVLRRRLLRAARRSARGPRPLRSPALPRWVGAAAAIVAVAALAGWNLLLAGRLDRAEARQGLMVQAVAAVGRPDASVVPMRGAGGIRAAMIYVHDTEESYFVASGLPQPSGDYQLWLVGSAGWVSLGTFEPEEGTALVRSTTVTEGLRQVVVTQEPEGGSGRPSGAWVVSAEIPRDGNEESGNSGPGGDGSSGPG
jgi:anti-sigma-K factor RskA